MKHASELVVVSIAAHKSSIQTVVNKITEAASQGKFSVDVVCATRDEMIAVVLSAKSMGYEVMATSSTVHKLNIAWSDV